MDSWLPSRVAPRMCSLLDLYCVARMPRGSGKLGRQAVPHTAAGRRQGWNQKLGWGAGGHPPRTLASSRNSHSFLLARLISERTTVAFLKPAFL